MATVIRQRGTTDCAIAAMATLASWLPYEVLAREGRDVEPRWNGLRGYVNREVVELARRFDIVLHPTRRYNLDRDGGILRVRWNTRQVRAQAGQTEHFVCVRRGLVCDPADGSVTPWREYVSRHGVTLLTLLRD
jgi:hypothetical protein